jgi:WD40 repeat protein/serine/threonine protein kinase/tetratricopeptide (TPR) repeat protein
MQRTAPSVEQLFFGALELESSEARSAYLDMHCSDPNLRRRVEELLDGDAQGSGFLECPAAPPTLTVDSPSLSEGPVTAIGPYKLREQIGEGGMGVVYVAEQTHPVRRKVALKIIKPGMDTRQVVARFEAERQALAMMDHPNIAKVHDGGTTESGRPYFVMELVRGLSITEYCDAERLSIRERLELFVLVCRAVQHAHQKGIIHRDLKPSNILVTLHDGLPVPKVIDFGVAKATGQSLTERTMYTAFTQLVGTPLYMSPEQVELSGLDVDTRSDVYSLGVLLYELLTGTTPFDSETLKYAAFDEMRRIIREEEPPKPSTRLSTPCATLTATAARRSSDPRQLNRSVQGELDWIVMKSLEKDRRRRYETANDFAADVMRYLTDQPVEACTPSPSYRFQKFARRNKAVLTTAALVVAALYIGAVVSTWQAVRATQAEGRADGQRKLAESSAAEAQRQTNEARKAQGEALRAKQEADHQRNVVSQNLYYADMRLALVDWTAGNIGRLSNKLLSQVPRDGGEDQRGWEWYYLLALCHEDERTLMQHVRQVDCVDWSPDGRRFASTGSDGVVAVYDPTKWQTLRTWQGEHIWGGHWSPDSQRFAWTTTGPDDGLYVGQVETGEKLPLLGHMGSGKAPAWSPDGKHLASRGSSGVRLWDPATGISIGVLDAAGWDIGLMAWGPNGKLLVLASEGRELATWDAVSGKGSRAVPSMTGMVSAAWSPDGKRLALAMATGKCLVYKTTDWSVAGQWDAHTGPVRAVAWHPDGSQFASAGADHLIQVWDPTTRKNLRTLRGHRNQVIALAWEPNGRRLASGGMDGLVKIWPLDRAQQLRRLEGHAGGVRAMSWSEDGETLRSLGVADGTIALWNVVNDQPLSKLRVSASASASAQFSPGARLLAIATTDEKKPQIFIHNARSGELVQTVKKATIPAGLSAFSPDASRLAISNGPTLEILDLRLDEVLFRWGGRSYDAFSWSPDGRFLAAGGRGETNHIGIPAFGAWVHIFDTEMRQRLFKMQHGTSWHSVTAVAWSPDGKRLASGDGNGLVEVWEGPTGQKVASVELHTAWVSAMAWSPDGRRVASGSTDGTVRIWEPIRGEELLKLDTSKSNPTHLEWSPNGRRLGVATADGAIRIWDATAGYEFVHSEPYRFEQVRDLLNQATQLWQAGRKNEARALYEQTLEENKPKLGSFPRWVGMSIMIRADVASRTGQYEEAVELYQLLARLYKDAAVQEGLGRALDGQGRLDEAIASYREAIRLDKDYYLAHNNMGNALDTKGRSDEAIASYREAIRIKNDFAGAHSNLGIVFFHKSQLDQAIASFREAVRLKNDEASFHSNLGAALFEKGEWDQAIAALREAVRLKNDEASFHSNLGAALFEKGQLDEAIAAYREAIRLKNDVASAHDSLGGALLLRGRFDEAISSYRDAIRINKDDANPHANLAKALHAQGELDGAIASFHDSIRLNKDQQDAHSNLGITLQAKGQLDEAIASFREAIRLKKLSATLRNEEYWVASFGENTLECDLINLGNALHGKGRLDEAVACYQEVLRNYLQSTRSSQNSAKFDSTPHRIMARFLATCPETGFRDVPRALELAQKAVKLAPSEYRAWSTLGVARYRAADWKAAIEALEKSGDLRQGGDSFDWFFRAMAHWQMGQKSEARKWYDQAVQWMDKTQPKNVELNRIRAEAEELLGIKAQQR